MEIETIKHLASTKAQDIIYELEKDVTIKESINKANEQFSNIRNQVISIKEKYGLPADDYYLLKVDGYITFEELFRKSLDSLFIYYEKQLSLKCVDLMLTKHVEELL